MNMKNKNNVENWANWLTELRLAKRETVTVNTNANRGRNMVVVGLNGNVVKFGNPAPVNRPMVTRFYRAAAVRGVKI